MGLRVIHDHYKAAEDLALVPAKTKPELSRQLARTESAIGLPLPPSRRTCFFRQPNW